jgi:hypothetical protein
MVFLLGFGFFRALKQKARAFVVVAKGKRGAGSGLITRLQFHEVKRNAAHERRGAPRAGAF